MAATVSVNISGSLLASLLYEHANSATDEEGFLLGEIISCITDTISDSQIRGEKEEVCLNIYAILPCGKTFSFYDGRGHIKQEKLEELLHGKQREVVGWYKFRRNSTLSISLRERTVHSNLVSTLVSSYEKYFIFGLFTCATSLNDSTHSYDHVFLRTMGTKFESVPLKVINLEDTSHSEYRLYPPMVFNTHSGQFGQVIRDSRKKFVGLDTTVSQVQEIHSALQTKLESLQEQVSTSEAITATMVMEVRELRERLSSIQEMKGALLEEKEPGLPAMEGVEDDLKVTKDPDSAVSHVTDTQCEDFCRTIKGCDGDLPATGSPAGDTECSSSKMDTEEADGNMQVDEVSRLHLSRDVQL